MACNGFPMPIHLWFYRNNSSLIPGQLRRTVIGYLANNMDGGFFFYSLWYCKGNVRQFSIPDADISVESFRFFILPPFIMQLVTIRIKCSFRAEFDLASRFCPDVQIVCQFYYRRVIGFFVSGHTPIRPCREIILKGIGPAPDGFNSKVKTKNCLSMLMNFSF